MLLAAFAACALPLYCFAQDKPAAPLRPPPADKSLLDLYKTGGFLMHPILLCSIGTIAVSVYCFMQINSEEDDAEAAGRFADALDDAARPSRAMSSARRIRIPLPTLMRRRC
jgi:hypothetical protein